MKRKFNKGDKIMFRSKTWTVCAGGVSDTAGKDFKYKISRGAWKWLVPGNQLRKLVA